MHKYLRMFNYGFKSQLAEKAQITGRVFLYLIIIFLFSQVFEAVTAQSQRFWYIAVTESVILSSSAVMFDIASDVASEKIIYFSGRPISYVAMKFCEAMGVSTFRYMVVGGACAIVNFIFFAYPITHIANYIVGFLSGFIGLAIYNMILCVIGLSAFWVNEIKNIFFLNLTSSFLFGGLIMPINYYSESVVKLSYYLPYLWVLWWPAATISMETHHVEYYPAFVSVWVLILAFLLSAIFSRAKARFKEEGE